MSDFLFHKVSEEEKESIKQEAKEVMEKFSFKLSKLDEGVSESGIDRKDFARDEKKDDLIPSANPDHPPQDDDFRKRMFDNAPNKNDDFIIAEKKGW